MCISVRFLANVEDIKNLRLVPYTTIHIDSFYRKLKSVRAVVVKRKAILIVVFLYKILPYLRLCEMVALMLAAFWTRFWLIWLLV